MESQCLKHRKKDKWKLLRLAKSDVMYNETFADAVCDQSHNDHNDRSALGISTPYFDKQINISCSHRSCIDEIGGLGMERKVTHHPLGFPTDMRLLRVTFM